MAAVLQRFALQDWRAEAQCNENALPSPREKRSDALSALIFHMIAGAPDPVAPFSHTRLS